MHAASRIIHLTALGLGAILATAPPAFSRDGEPPGGARMTVELAWERADGDPDPGAGDEAPSWEIAIHGGGEIAGAVAWPPEAGGEPPKPATEGQGAWRLGARSGRVRLRIEAPLSAVLRAGPEEGGLAVHLQDLLDGPQERKDASGRIVCARLPWDALEIRRLDVEAVGDGGVAPRAVVPVSIGANILTPSACEVGLRVQAELRPLNGGKALWHQDRRLIVATNSAPAEAARWEIQAPAAPGTYLLECEANWEFLEGRSPLHLSRWFSRRKTLGEANRARRHLSLVVVDPAAAGAEPRPQPAVAAAAEPTASIVDAVDLSRPRGRELAWGLRHPSAGSELDPWPIPDDALKPAHWRREFFREFLSRPGSASPAVLDPAGAGGLAWTSLALHVPHPGRPHRLSIAVTGGHPSALGVGLIAPAEAPRESRVLLDAGTSGSPIAEGGQVATYSWTVWPDGPAPVLVLVNRGIGTWVQVGSVQLAELSQVPAGPFAVDRGHGPRKLAMDLTPPGSLDRFGGGTSSGPRDLHALAKNLADYLESCGANAVILGDGPAREAGELPLDGQAVEDATAPDCLAILLPALRRRGLSVWLAVDEPAEAAGLSPLQPEALGHWRGRVVAALSPRGGDRAEGVVIRLGGESTLPIGPQAGLDDATYRRFATSAFDAMTAAEVPGLDPAVSGRMEARRAFVSGPGRIPWVTWKGREVAAFYRALAESAEAAAPGARLAVVTPTSRQGGFQRAMRAADRAGKPPEEVWRDAGLDLGHWKVANDSGPIVLGGIDPGHDASGVDLAGHMDLDGSLAALPRRGIAEVPGPGSLGPSGRPQLASRSNSQAALSGATTVASDGSTALAHALAALDAGWVLLSAEGTAGDEGRVRRFARLYGELPASAPAIASAPGQEQGYAARIYRRGDASLLTMVNDTPYPVLLEALVEGAAGAPVEDLKRGIRLAPEAADGRIRLVLEIGPHDLTTLRLGSANASVVEVRPHHSDLVKEQMKLQAESLSSWLQQLQKQGEGGAAKPEAEEAGIVRAVKLEHGEGQSGGWKADGAEGNAIRQDRSRDGSGLSLRLDASILPASAASPRVEPPSGRVLTIGAWFRSDQPELPVRIWLEGESDGKPVVRSVEVRATSRWTPVNIPVANLPEAGVDRVRLRLELLAPGRLWADDVTLTSTGLSRPEVLTTRRAIFSALQAYRDGRVGDFARLVESRWVRPALEPMRTTALPEARPIR